MSYQYIKLNADPLRFSDGEVIQAEPPYGQLPNYGVLALIRTLVGKLKGEYPAAGTARVTLFATGSALQTFHALQLPEADKLDLVCVHVEFAGTTYEYILAPLDTCVQSISETILNNIRESRRKGN